jgi:hypothetical protein
LRTQLDDLSSMMAILGNVMPSQSHSKSCVSTFRSQYICIVYVQWNPVGRFPVPANLVLFSPPITANRHFQHSHLVFSVPRIARQRSSRCPSQGTQKFASLRGPNCGTSSLRLDRPLPTRRCSVPRIKSISPGPECLFRHYLAPWLFQCCQLS